MSLKLLFILLLGILFVLSLNCSLLFGGVLLLLLLLLSVRGGVEVEGEGDGEEEGEGEEQEGEVPRERGLFEELFGIGMEERDEERGEREEKEP